MGRLRGGVAGQGRVPRRPPPKPLSVPPQYSSRSLSDNAAASDSVSRVLAAGRSMADCAAALDVYAGQLVGSGLVASGGFCAPVEPYFDRDFAWLPESPRAFPQDRVVRCETCGAPGQVRRCHYCGTLL